MLACVALLGGCRGGGTPPGLRAADGLLERPELRALVEAGARGDVARLLAGLEAPDAAVRARSAFALASTGSAAAVPALLRRLGDPAARVRADAAFALGHAGDTAAAPALLEALGREEEPAVRRQLLEALGRTVGTREADGLARLEPTDGREAAVVALALSRALVRGAASGAALERTVAGLEARDPAVRARFAWGLATTPHARAWAPRRRAVRLALDGYGRTDPAALHLMAALARIGDPFTPVRILEWLRTSPDWRIRAGAARALAGREGAADLREGLLAALEDPSPHVRGVAAATLAGSPQPPAVADRVAGWLRAHPGDVGTAGPLLVLLAVAGRGGEVEGWLRQADPPGEGRWRNALAAVAYLGGPGAVELMEEAVRAPFPRVAASARAALRRRRDAGPGRPPGDPEGGDRPGSVPRGSAPDVPGPGAPVDWSLLHGLGAGPELVLETGRGRLVVRMLVEEAPLSTWTVVRLAREGRLDGARVDRVVPGRVARTEPFAAAGPPLERTRLAWERGVVGLVVTANPAAASLVLAHDRLPDLDGRHTALGWVAEGAEVVDRLLEGDRILSARVRSGRRGRRGRRGSSGRPGARRA